jgi:hypothetical protein
MDSVTYYADLREGYNDSCTSLTWRQLYSARQVYDSKGNWPSTEPLSGRFWFEVAENIKNDPEVAHQFMKRAFRNSPAAPDCHDEQCRMEAYCYATSMTVPQALQCRLEHGVKMKKLLTGAPTYPMPRPLRNAMEDA